MKRYRHTCADTQTHMSKNTDVQTQKYTYTETKYVKEIFKYKVRLGQTNRQSHTCKNRHICADNQMGERKKSQTHMCRHIDTQKHMCIKCKKINFTGICMSNFQCQVEAFNNTLVRRK